MSCNLDLKKRG